MTTNHPTLKSIATRTGMVYGEINYRAVLRLLNTTHIKRPVGIKTERLAAMIVQASKNHPNEDWS